AEPDNASINKQTQVIPQDSKLQDPPKAEEPLVVEAKATEELNTEDEGGNSYNYQQNVQRQPETYTKPVTTVEKTQDIKEKPHVPKRGSAMIIREAYIYTDKGKWSGEGEIYRHGKTSDKFSTGFKLTYEDVGQRFLKCHYVDLQGKHIWAFILKEDTDYREQ